jgi:hypothetical protein
MKKEMKKEMPAKKGGKTMPAFMDKKMANGGKVMKYADGGMAGCGHRGAQDYGKK